MHRVRVGAIGLACVFLVVMLATAFLRAAGDPSVTAVNSTAVNEQAPTEPLAALGVAPGNPPPTDDQPKTGSKPAGAGQ